MSDNSFSGIPERLRAGEEAAASEVFARYTNRLIGLARKRLDDRVRTRVSEDDVIQSVYRTFFRRQQIGKFELTGWDSLWSLLAQITVRNCCRQAEAQRAARSRNR